MSDKIENYITKLIDGSESREDLTHFQNEFKKYVTLPKIAEIYKSTVGSWKQLLKPILKGSDPYNLILIDSIVTEEQFWEGIRDLTEAKSTSVVSESFIKILQQHHVLKPPLVHLREFRERIDVILDARLKMTYINQLIVNEEEEWRKTKDLVKNEIKEILSVEFMHALGGQELLGVVWNQFNPAKSLAEANSMEIALFLQNQMNQRNQNICIPVAKMVNIISTYKPNNSSDAQKANYEKREVGNKNEKNYNNNNNNNNSFKPQQQTKSPQQQQQQKPKNVLIQKRKVEEKTGDGCETCLKAGKTKAAATHSTTQHDSSYVNKKWGDKKQKVESKAKNQ